MRAETHCISPHPHWNESKGMCTSVNTQGQGELERRHESTETAGRGMTNLWSEGCDTESVCNEGHPQDKKDACYISTAESLRGAEPWGTNTAQKCSPFPSLLLTTNTPSHLPFPQKSKVLFSGEGERKERLQIQSQQAHWKAGKGAGLKMGLYGNLHRSGKLSSPFLCLTSEIISQACELTPLPADIGWFPSEDTDRLWKEPLQTDICMCFCGVEFQDKIDGAIPNHMPKQQQKSLPVDQYQPCSRASNYPWQSKMPTFGGKVQQQSREGKEF